jgi:dihydrofolate reductase
MSDGLFDVRPWASGMELVALKNDQIGELAMRKVITGAFVSLDGVMQAPGGPKEDTTGGFALGGWVVPHMDGALGEAIEEMFGQPFDLLLGRRTYEIFAAHWPYAAEGGDYGFIAKQFNSVTKYVATRSTMALTWKGSIALHDAAADVARLKQESGPPLVTQGSSELIQTLLANDLIDEIRMFIFPIVLGTGKRLFGSGAKPAAFTLIDKGITTTGVTIGRYQRAGEVVSGDYAMDPPTPDEVARRAKMNREG